MAGLRDRLFTLADTSRSVIVDLDQVSFIDAAGLGALVGAARRADIHGASLQMVCGQPQIRELFRLRGIAVSAGEAADADPVARAVGQSLTAALATGNGPCAGPLSSGG